jgi:hypothetical protein
MPRISSELFCLIPLTIFAIVGFGLAKILTTRTRLPGALSIVIALLAACALSLFVGFPFQFRLYRWVEARIAQPYVQAALNDQCSEGLFTADMSGFYVETFPYGDPDSGFSAGEALHWRSSDSAVDCVYSRYEMNQWTCTCPCKSILTAFRIPLYTSPC